MPTLTFDLVNDDRSSTVESLPQKAVEDNCKFFAILCHVLQFIVLHFHVLHFYVLQYHAWQFLCSSFSAPCTLRESEKMTNFLYWIVCVCACVRVQCTHTRTHTKITLLRSVNWQVPLTVTLH